MLALLNDDVLPCTMVSMFLTANDVYRGSWDISEQYDVLSLGFSNFCSQICLSLFGIGNFSTKQYRLY